MPGLTALTPQMLRRSVGSELALSDWLEVDAGTASAFAGLIGGSGVVSTGGEVVAGLTGDAVAGSARTSERAGAVGYEGIAGLSVDGRAADPAGDAELAGVTENEGGTGTMVHVGMTGPDDALRGGARARRDQASGLTDPEGAAGHAGARDAADLDVWGGLTAAPDQGSGPAADMLILSLLGRLYDAAMPRLIGETMSMNYGFDALRFGPGVHPGARIRARFRLANLAERPPGGLMMTLDTIVEVEGRPEPAVTARWLCLSVFEQGDDQAS